MVRDSDKGQIASNRRTLLKGIAGAGVVAAAGRSITSQASSASMTRTAVVATSNGPVRGQINNGIQTFKGLRYGAPTGGANRFLPPRKPTPWADVADATAYGNSAVQGNIPGMDLSKDAPSMRLNGADKENKVASEDCLFLNVWTPALDAKKRPVMVWLHGGGFAIGSGSQAVYEGSNLARQGDVVVVTINHRLGALGYAQVDHLLGPDYASSGMAGMLDIVAALEWVRDNAAAFGGDVGNVTIFGESGGGYKVSVLLAMPKAKGLFHRAIIQSGPGLEMVPKAEAQDLATGMLNALKIPAAEARRLLDVTSADLMQSAAQAAASSATFPLIGRLRGFAPVIDGITLPRDPFNPTAPEISADIPVMIGTTRTEATLFVMNVPGITQIDWAGAEKWMTPILKERTAPAMALYRRRNPSASPYDVLTDMLTQAGGRAGDIRLAERKIAQRAAPIWVYRLDWKTPAMGGVLKSPHALDLTLVFDNTEKLPILMGTGPEAKQVARQMASTWIAFARNGNPDNPTVPHWPAYSLEERNVMLFNVKSTVARDPDSEERKFWAG